jgi:fermentation-respiration switch protein FrsA (DUF1100 family)
MKTNVTFDSAGVSIAGHLYIPDDTATGPYPAIVVGHPGSGVKEQAAGLYAERLAEQGFATLAFDAAYQGESGGEPHGLEDPAHRVEDFKAAVSYLTTRNEVDPHQIGLLGICASGGFVLPATGTDHRVKAVATVSGVDLGRHFRQGGDGAQDPAAFQGLLDAAASARTKAANGEDPGMMPLLPDTIEHARALAGEYGAEGFEYYRTPRGEHPRSTRAYPWESVDKIGAFDAYSLLSLIGQRPVLLIVGTRAVTSWMSVEAFEKAVGPKELHWIDGASHVDLYDKPEYVNPAVAHLADFFQTHLAGVPDAAAPIPTGP